jgi:alanyl-tRNA synthetase
MLPYADVCCRPLTDDSNKFIWHQALPASVQAVYTEKGFLSHADKAGLDEPVGIIVDKTSYYAESGGQVTSKAVNQILLYQ